MRKALTTAATIEDLHAVLLPVIDQAATPDLVPQGAMLLQPSEERRRSGSHYTPRELTDPIVRATLDPIFARLRRTKPVRPEEILDLKVCDPAMGSGAFLVETCRFLGDSLVEAWRIYDARPAIPPDEDEVVFARRLVAQRCIYGVDRNPVAVDLAKMSLWLVTLAKDHALTFVDHALRYGDSLVGLSRRQLEAFHWDASHPQIETVTNVIRPHLEGISALRRQIREANEDVSDRGLRALWDKAQSELGKVRLVGDLAVAAWFEAGNSKGREAKRLEFSNVVVSGEAERWQSWLDKRRHHDPPLAPFHWEIEFPEVFERENPGFDAFVGNPPFMGGTIISTKLGQAYLEWLHDGYKGAQNRCDLVAYFFRRAFGQLRANGTFGMIATNTIAQGDTRAGGLRWICTHGGEIFAAHERVKWPGMAAVVVSVVHVINGRFEGAKLLDDREVETITAFLFHRGGHEDPLRLAVNGNKQFEGVKIYGQGFIFDDTDTKGTATSIAEMERIIEKHPKCREVIFPYIGGEEVNASPTHAHYRHVINFFDWPAEKAASYWECWRIVENKVKPGRQRKDKNGKFELRAPLPDRYWQYAEKRPGLYGAIAGLKQVLGISRVSQHTAFAFLPAGMIYAESLIIFPFFTHAAFSNLQARPHEIWARFFGSSLEDRLRYTPSDCFDTFPFPENWEIHPTLEADGRAYYEFRAALMVRNNEGLTKTYNRFHDPYERDPNIQNLRELHAAMDRTVLRAYGWEDLSASCEFLLDYEIDETEWGEKKKPYRYRWPDDVQAEVLARLLDLNAERARAEASVISAAGGKKRSKRALPSAMPESTNRDLFS